jgi:hypothetical protein
MSYEKNKARKSHFLNPHEGIRMYMAVQSLDKSQFMFFNLNNISTITFSICWKESNIWKSYLQRCEVFNWEPMKKGILMRVSHPNGNEDRLLIGKKKQRDIMKKLKELMTHDISNEELYDDGWNLRWEEE